MYTINFNSHDHNFCESTIYSNEPHPEYLNALSSLFITFIGINGLIKPNIHFLLSILYTGLVVNGITSCFYHWTNTIGWGILDRMSMILIAMSSINLFVNKINYIIILEKWKRIILINRLIILLVTIYFTILLTIAGLHMETLFNICFGLFLSSLIVFIHLIDKHQLNLRIPNSIISLGWSGVKYILVSGAFWILTENLCHSFTIIKYMFGHVWWHFFVSYGGYLISLIPNYMYMQQLQLKNNRVIKITHDQFGIPYLIFDTKFYDRTVFNSKYYNESLSYPSMSLNNHLINIYNTNELNPTDIDVILC